MKKLFIILIAGGIAVAGISWTSKIFSLVNVQNVQNNQVLILSKSFNIDEVKTVSATTSGGSITVTGDANGSASIEVFGQGNNGKSLSKDEIMTILNRDYDFSVTAQNGVLKATAKRKVQGMWKKAVSISFKIHTAKNVATDLHTSGGSIWLGGLEGAEKFSTSGGSIHFENLSGDIDGHTSGGTIAASNSKGNIKASTSGGSLDIENLSGDIQMHTSGGSIDANGIKGNLDLSTSGGSIHLNNIAAKLSAHTSGGGIHADFTSLEQDADLSTSGGSVKINIPNASKMNFELKGSKVEVGAANNIQMQMNKEKDYATGSLNSGGVKLNARTSGGTVSLDFK